jgi:hypothetical protein
LKIIFSVKNDANHLLIRHLDKKNLLVNKKNITASSYFLSAKKRAGLVIFQNQINHNLLC